MRRRLGQPALHLQHGPEVAVRLCIVGRQAQRLVKARLRVRNPAGLNVLQASRLCAAGSFGLLRTCSSALAMSVASARRK